MNIIYIDPKFTKGRDYPIYSGVYNELEKIANCYLYQEVVSDISVVLKSCPFEPDVIIFGLGWFASKSFGIIKGLREINIPVLSYMFKPQNEWQEKLESCKNNGVDMILTPVPSCEKDSKKTGISIRLFKYGANPSIFKDWGEKKIYDFGFSGALHDSKHYIKGAFSSVNLRRRVNNLLKNRKEFNCFLNGSDSIAPRISSHEEYSKIMNRSKIWLSTPSPFNDMPSRYLQVGLSKALIFTSPIPEGYRNLYIDGVNCVEFSDDLTDFIEKLNYYLSNDLKRNEIIENAYDEFINNHTWKHRAEELLQIIKYLRG